LLVRLPPRALGADGDKADRRQVVGRAAASAGAVGVGVTVATTAACSEREGRHHGGRRREKAARPLRAHILLLCVTRHPMCPWPVGRNRRVSMPRLARSTLTLPFCPSHLARTIVTRL